MVELVLAIIESKRKKETIYTLLTNIRKKSIYNNRLTIPFTTDQLIMEMISILEIPKKFRIYSIKGIHIYNTIKMLMINQIETIIQKYTFKLVDQQPREFLVQALFKKPWMGRIPLFKQSMLLPNVSLFFQDHSIDRLTIYTCKVKTTYSDIIEIKYIHNPDRVKDPVTIQVKMIKNPISLDVYQNYPQIIQTYYCFYLLTNTLFMDQFTILLDSDGKPSRPPFIQTRKESILANKYRLNGGVRPGDLKKALEMDKRQQIKERNDHDYLYSRKYTTHLRIILGSL